MPAARVSDHADARAERFQEELAQDNAIVVFVALLREFDLLVRDRLREYDLAD